MLVETVQVVYADPITIIGVVSAVAGTIASIASKPGTPDIPTPEDPALEAERNKQRVLAKNAKGRQGTILTSGRGLDDEALVGKKSLLGQ